MCSVDPATNSLLKEAFRFFTHEEITLSLTPPTIMIGPLKEQRAITEKTFYDF
jgi:hypothetical protein